LFPRIEYQQDTSYGSAKRTPALRFPDSIVEPQVDGSLSIKADTREFSDLFGDIFQSWVLSGGGITAVQNAPNDWHVTIADTAVLIAGHRYVVPSAKITGLLDNSIYYVYVNVAAECFTFEVSTLLPVALDPEANGQDGVLIGKVDTSGAGTITDLRNPLQDVDKRIDITVGRNYGAALPVPHFENLATAIAYANEIMTPEGASSYSGPNLRIQVVGSTLEPLASVPIQIETDGLVIEGSPRVSTLAGTPQPPLIQWFSDTPLIDFL
jgi:hypothetical protein